MKWRRTFTRALAVAAGLFAFWFPVAWLSTLARNPVTGEEVNHPIGSCFMIVKRVLEFPFDFIYSPVNAPWISMGIYLAFWVPFILFIWHLMDRRKERASINDLPK